MKKSRKILYIILFIAIILLIGTVKSKAGYLNLNSLDFNVQINNDGSIDVTETWDIRIKETNTLYKSFKTDSSKYSNITNVTVKDITNGIKIISSLRIIIGNIMYKKDIIMEQKMKMEILKLVGELD